jgi:hypothetical protein
MNDFASRVAGEVAAKQEDQSRFAALVAGERDEAMREYMSREFCPECGHSLPAHDHECPRGVK